MPKTPQYISLHQSQTRPFNKLKADNTCRESSVLLPIIVSIADRVQLNLVISPLVKLPNSPLTMLKRGIDFLQCILPH